MAPARARGRAGVGQTSARRFPRLPALPRPTADRACVDPAPLLRVAHVLPVPHASRSGGEFADQKHSDAQTGEAVAALFDERPDRGADESAAVAQEGTAQRPGTPTRP